MKFSELSTSAAIVCLVNDEKFEFGIHTVDATLTSSQLFTGTLFVIGIYYCFHFQIDQEVCLMLASTEWATMIFVFRSLFDAAFKILEAAIPEIPERWHRSRYIKKVTSAFFCWVIFISSQFSTVFSYLSFSPSIRTTLYNDHNKNKEICPARHGRRLCQRVCQD